MSVVEGKPRIRHSHQFEIKLRYAFPKEQKKTVYDLAVYFFLPPSLGISGTSYQKGNFYEDVQSYIRLKTPEVSFTDIPQGGSGPLSRLNAATLRLQGDTTDRSVRLYEYQSKLFRCVLKSSLREYFARVEAARWLFDHKTTLYANPKDRIGVCSESVDFLDASMVSEAVAAVRNRRILDVFWTPLYTAGVLVARSYRSTASRAHIRTDRPPNDRVA